MYKKLMPIMALALITTSCGMKKTNDEESVSAGIRIENMDLEAKPGKDFYQYACGGWMKNHPLTDEYSRFGSFDKLGEDNKLQVKNLIEGIAAQEQEEGSESKKIADLYNIVMNEEKLNSEGASPINGDLKFIAALENKDNIASLMAIMPYADIFFSVYVNADVMDSKSNILYTQQAGIGMGQRDYYLDSSESMSNIRKEYISYVTKMFKLTNVDFIDPVKAAKAVIRIETALAEAHSTQVQLRDIKANYNIYNLDKLNQEFQGFNWKYYLDAIGANVEHICVSQPKAIQAVVDIINNYDLEDIKYYIQWRLIESAANTLSSEFTDEHFNFYGRIMSGKQQDSPRWKKAVEVVNTSLGEAVGHEYVNRYFSSNAKARMEALVHDLLKAYEGRIKNLDWMSDETKNKAYEKLSTFRVKVGYPNKWKDYSDLDISTDYTFWENKKRIASFNQSQMIDELMQSVDPDKWFMTPQTVNAYYNPNTNEICFPAGILQYPFFDMNADDAFNYGAIGVVIAHEITHGFDDQGSQFDKDGNLANWWTLGDKEQFDKRANVMVEYFNSIEVADGLCANGRFTLGENLADHGGLQVAYFALQNKLNTNPLPVINDLTAEQRFFIAYANVWAGNIRPEEIVKRTKTDPHSLGMWRVNGALPHINAWYDAFNIDKHSPLYLEPEKRVSIW